MKLWQTRILQLTAPRQSCLELALSTQIYNLILSLIIRVNLFLFFRDYIVFLLWLPHFLEFLTYLTLNEKEYLDLTRVRNTLRIWPLSDATQAKTGIQDYVSA